MMNELQCLEFERACAMWQEGKRAEALGSLRKLATGIVDSDDQAGLIYHEIIWHLDLDDVPGARALLGKLNRIISSIASSSHDSSETAPDVSLTLMAGFAEARVLMEERRGSEAFRTLRELESDFPKQLALPAFDSIRVQIPILKGMILANDDRWAEARPFLEDSPVPPGWEGIASYYLGHLYYSRGEFAKARDKLVEALSFELPSRWAYRSYYILGMSEYKLSNMVNARKQLENCANIADDEFLEEVNVWGWLEAASRALGQDVSAAEWRTKSAQRASRKPN
jgi:tetratricopeptide (TPR) repeat protein